VDKVISRHAENWQISRMAVVDKNILRLGVYELMHTEDIPPKVTINEAVELAKRFGDLDSPKFINGILDSVFRKENIKKVK
jgi:N utilization substance protein B